MRGQVNDKAHMELILKSIDNVFEFTAKHETYEQFEAEKSTVPKIRISDNHKSPKSPPVSDLSISW